MFSGMLLYPSSKITRRNGPPKLGSKTRSKRWDQVARISIMMLKRSSRAKSGSWFLEKQPDCSWGMKRHLGWYSDYLTSHKPIALSN